MGSMLSSLCEHTICQNDDIDECGEAISVGNFLDMS